MGKRGPKPAPTHLKLLRGDAEDRINRDEPIPSEPEDGIIQPPEELSEDAKKVWDYYAEDLEDKGCLTPWDVDTFAVFCNAVAIYRDCKKKMGRQYTDKGAAGGVIKSPYWQIMRDCSEQIAKFSSRFGFTPGDRADLVIEKKAPTGEGAERILG